MSPELVILVAILVVWFVIARHVLERLAGRDRLSTFARGLRGWQPDGWAVGVQEEDVDRRWGRDAPGMHPTPDRSAEPADGPSLEPVKPAIRVR